MEPLVISLIAFGCIFGGVLLGMVLRTVLPEHHLSDESRDVVKRGLARSPPWPPWSLAY